MILHYYNENTVDGIRYQFAHPTASFWSSWRLDRSALAMAGICLSHTYDDLGSKVYTVIRSSKIGSENIPEPVKVSPYMIRDKKGLLDYQVPAVGDLLSSLLSNGFALDASDTGTGKTYTGVKTAVLSGLQPAIICTKTTIRDWKTVCGIFKVNPVFIYNWESSIGRIYRNNGVITKVTQPPNKYIQMSYHPYTGKPVFNWRISPDAKVVIIFDEIHKANGDGSTNQALVKSARDMGYKIIGLSATACHKLGKLRMLGSLIGLFEYDNFHEWLKEKGCYIDSNDNWQDTNEKEVMKKINKYIFPNYGTRVRKKDIPDFPPCQNIAKLYNILKSDLQNKNFESTEKKIAEIESAKVKGYKFQILALRMKHRQIAELYKVPLLIDLAKEYVEAGHSVIIFTNFTSTLETIIKKLKIECYIAGTVNGKRQKDDHRALCLDNFTNGIERIIVCNMQASATGTDGLQDKLGNYSRVGLIPPCDDPVLMKQVLGRIDRTNSKSNSMNILVYSARTVEEKVFANVHNKINNIDLLNDGDLADHVTFKQG